MKTNKKIWVILILTLVLAAQVFAQSGTTPEGFLWQIEGSGVTITDYRGTSRELTIPAELNGRPVRTMGDEAFSSRRLTRVSIPSSVTYIGSSAFAFNQLTSVTIPNSVTAIASGAFYENQLNSVNISSSVISIGNWAFSENQLTSITIGANVEMANGAFDNGFAAYYNSQGRRAGTYTWSGTAWTRQ